MRQTHCLRGTRMAALRAPEPCSLLRPGKTLSLFRGSRLQNIEEILEQVRQTIRDSLVEFVRRGVREASRGHYHTGQALDWSRLSFSERSKEIINVLKEAIRQKTGQEKMEELYVELSNSKLLTIVSAIPAAFSIAAAREIAGLPFLEDHLHMEQLKRGVVGPIHIVGYHKGVTERQALSFLGYPDSTVVVTPFGIYAADEVQNIQLVLISNCRDETTTRHGVQRFFDWIEQTGEDQYLLKMAESRKQIVRATRNCVEHPKPEQRLVTVDFSVDARNVLLPPTVEIIDPSTPLPKVSVNAFFKQTFKNLVRVVELMVVFLCARHVSTIGGLPVQVVEFPQKRGSSPHVRYGYGTKIGDEIVPMS